MYCTNCGKQLSKGAIFCANCGARQTAAPPPSVLHESPAPPQPYAAPAAQKELYFTLSSQWYRVLADGTADPVALSAANNKPIGELAKPEGERFVLVDYAAYQAGISQTLYVYPTSSPVINPISGASCWNSLTGATLTSTVIN